MKTIWKFYADLADTVTVTMPVGAKVLHAHPHRDGINLWAIVDPNEDDEQRTFHVRGTGHPLGVVGRHVGTVHDGPFVWHVFEDLP